jgi:hypothetical protein
LKSNHVCAGFEPLYLDSDVVSDRPDKIDRIPPFVNRQSSFPVLPGWVFRVNNNIKNPNWKTVDPFCNPIMRLKLMAFVLMFKSVYEFGASVFALRASPRKVRLRPVFA